MISFWKRASKMPFGVLFPVHFTSWNCYYLWLNTALEPCLTLCNPHWYMSWNYCTFKVELQSYEKLFAFVKWVCRLCLSQQCSLSILVKSLSYFILYFKACLHVKVKYTLALKPGLTSSCMKTILIFILRQRKWFNVFLLQSNDTAGFLVLLKCWIYDWGKTHLLFIIAW